jgi:DNA mismatch repair protein MutL
MEAEAEESFRAERERLRHVTQLAQGVGAAGEALAPEEMRALYVALSATALPAHDVHGRCTVVRLTWDELERRFGRR